ncbi:hypothetical protein VPH35_018806 [Triticum aestivum]
MAPVGRYLWSDLDSELLASIAARMSLRDYACLHSVCAAWRSALTPPTYPRLLSLSPADDHGRRTASLVCLPMRRRFHLHTVYPTLDDGDDDRDGPVINRSVRVVGSGNGRFALAVDQKHKDPRPQGSVFPSGWKRRVVLVSPTPTEDYDEMSVRKVVFAPKPNAVWAVVALYNREKVAYIDGKVDKNWTTIGVLTGNMACLVDMAFDPAAADKVYLLDSRAGLHVLRVPRGGHNSLERAVVEPLAALVLNPNPTAAYTPPYDAASPLMVTKYIFFCHGSLYQKHRRKQANRIHFTMSAGEIFVLRYDPGRWPCWAAVMDLGGYSVFVGKISSPRRVRATALPGVRANSVYWMDGMGVPMVCDIATGISEPCVLPYGPCKDDCWYFNSEGPELKTVSMYKAGRNGSIISGIMHAN